MKHFSAAKAGLPNFSFVLQFCAVKNTFRDSSRYPVGSDLSVSMESEDEKTETDNGRE